MISRSILYKMAFGLMLAVCLFADSALAQEKATGTLDKGLATKHGVGESLAETEIDEEKVPGKLEAGIAFGSCAAMIFVVKAL